MTARAFLVRGLLAGLFAGVAAFAVGYFVAEPQIQSAINYEESHEDAAATHSHSDSDSGSASGESEEAEAGHHHDEGGTVVSRHNQRTWGLLTGTLAIGLALGGIVALVAAGVVGRIGALSPDNRLPWSRSSASWPSSWCRS